MDCLRFVKEELSSTAVVDDGAFVATGRYLQS